MKLYYYDRKDFNSSTRNTKPYLQYLYIPTICTRYANDVIGLKLYKLKRLFKAFERYKENLILTNDDDLLYAYASLS